MTKLSVIEVLNLLRRGPEQILDATSGAHPALLTNKPSPGDWSANDVLAHLRSCADAWGDCIERILSEDEPVIRAINPRTWIKSTSYPELNFIESMQAFLSQREL